MNDCSLPSPHMIFPAKNNNINFYYFDELYEINEHFTDKMNVPEKNDNFDDILFIKI